MIALTLYVTDLKRTALRMETRKSLYMKENEELVFRSTRTTTSGGLITKKLLKNITPMYLRCAINVEEETLSHYSGEAFERISFALELRRNGTAGASICRKYEFTEKLGRKLRIRFLFVNANYTHSIPSLFAVLFEDFKNCCSINRENNIVVFYFQRASLCCRFWKWFGILERCKAF